MRRDGVLPRGDWFRIENEAEKDDGPATIYIYDEIGFWGTEASDFVQELVRLDADEIDLRLNSPGGEVFDGLAIYNSLKQHKAKITVYVDGLAASAASFIAQAGDEIIMARNATMMIHDGIAFAYGNEADLRETADLLGKVSNNIADIYAQRAGQNVEYWRDLMRNELWMNGSEAVEFGLADRVLEADSEEADVATNKWDLATLYNHTGRARAESPTRIAARVMLENKEREKPMGDAPKNDGGSGSAEPEGGGQPTGDPNQPGVTVPPTDPGPKPTEPATEPAPEPTPENKATAPTASAQGVMINGKLETDWSVINQHMQSLQTAQNEARAQFRQDFIEGLSNSNKIAATQVDSLILLVNGDAENDPMSDEQFARFQASYESAGTAPLFNRTEQTNQPGVPGSTGVPGSNADMSAKEKEERISNLQGIVANLRRVMSEEKVQNSPSYKELAELTENEETA